MKTNSKKDITMKFNFESNFNFDYVEEDDLEDDNIGNNGNNKNNNKS